MWCKYLSVRFEYVLQPSLSKIVTTFWEQKKRAKGAFLGFAGGGRSLELTPISVPIPVNRVINWESNQYPPESNEATTPYHSKNAGYKRFCTTIKENLSGNFLAETGKQN